MTSARKPHVQITYDRQTGDGGTVKRELPFVVGVLGKFAGNRKQSVHSLADRKFIRINQENFDEILNRLAPELELRVENCLAEEDSELFLRMVFRSIDDFTPSSLVKNVDPLRQLFQTRRQLQKLLVHLDRKPRKPSPEPQARTAVHAAPPDGLLTGFLNSIIAQTSLSAPPSATADSTADLIHAETLPDLLRAWQDLNPDLSEANSPLAKIRIARQIARLDEVLTDQVNAILHAPEFQQLESAWRGLRFLVNETELAQSEQGAAKNIEIRVLSVGKEELFRDLDGAIEFDQSELFRKVYNEGLGLPGADPYGLLIGLYQFRNHPDDIDMLTKISEVAAAAFAPFIATTSPDLFGFANFLEFGSSSLTLATHFDQVEFLKWRALREQPDARFLGLTLPHILLRPPYGREHSMASGFMFEEQVAGDDDSRYLWGSAALGFAALVIRSFARTRWFIDIRGVEFRSPSTPQTEDIRPDYYAWDRQCLFPKQIANVLFDPELERELAVHGFLPLSAGYQNGSAVFRSNQSLNRPKKFADSNAEVNARISSMLQYVLCVSRFSHYLHSMALDRIGSVTDHFELETWLRRWLVNYKTNSDDPEIRARFPLREAEVAVRAEPGNAGAYRMEISLLPHSQLDELLINLRLVSVVERG